MEQLDKIIIIVYFILIAVIILMTRRARSIEDFALGGRKIPSAIIFGSLAATFIGPGYSMGLANKAAADGIIWLIIFMAFSLQTILVGYFIAPRLRSFSTALTLGDIMGYRYGKTVKLISGFLSVTLSIGFVGVIAKASGDIISGLTGLPFLWAVIISTILVIVYSTYGGIKSVLITDVLQFIILAISIPLVLIFVDVNEGLSHIISKIPSSNMSFTGHFSGFPLVGMFLGFLLGETLLPPYTNRALMASSISAAKKGFLKAGAFSIVWFFICVVIGLVGLVMFPESDNPFIAVLDGYLPAGLFGLAIAAIISIIMSSQDSILNAASVALKNDIINTLVKTNDDAKKTLHHTQWLNLAIGILATLFAINVPSIISALMYCYTIWAPTIVLPLIIAVLYPKAKPLAALFAIIAGAISTGIWEWVLGSPMQIPSLLVGIVTNQIVFWSIQLLSGEAASEGSLSPIYESNKIK